MVKHKSRLIAHGRKQEHASNLFKTLSPVVTWFTIRIVLVLSLISIWITRQVGFILSFPHANIKFNIYMTIIQGIETKRRSRTNHDLKLFKNLYGQRQGYRV